MNDSFRLDPERRALADSLFDIWTEAGRQHLRAAARAEGREEGRKEGREEGRKEGREEGRQEERRAMLLVRLEDLDALTAVRQQRIEAATAGQLATWKQLRRDALLEALDAVEEPTGG